MLRCFSSLGCPEASLDATLALAAGQGIPAVELRGLGGTIDLPAYFAQHFASPAVLGAHVRALGAAGRIVAVNLSLRLIGTSAAEREQLTAVMPWVEALRVPWLRVFDGGRAADATEIAEAGSTLAWWQELRQRQGWKAQVMVETHDSLLTADKISRLLHARPDTAILWDSHHTWRKGGEDPLQTWAAIRPRVVHIHVKDSIGVPSAKHPFTYVLPGNGGFPIAPLLAQLQRDGYASHVSLEWEKQWHPYLPPLEHALQVARDRAWW